MLPMWNPLALLNGQPGGFSRHHGRIGKELFECCILDIRLTGDSRLPISLLDGRKRLLAAGRVVLQALVMSGTGVPVSQQLAASERRIDGAYNGKRVAASAGVLACRSSRRTHAGYRMYPRRGVQRIAPPRPSFRSGITRLEDWLIDNADGPGRGCDSELRRNYRR